MAKPDELDYPDTTFVRDIENRVFQTIVAQVLSETPGVASVEGNIFDSIFGHEKIKGITVEQKSKSQSVSVKIEVNMAFGTKIPAKCEEIQSKVIQAITDLTGLHVSHVHVIVKGVIPAVQPQIEVVSADDAEVELPV